MSAEFISSLNSPVPGIAMLDQAKPIDILKPDFQVHTWKTALVLTNTAQATVLLIPSFLYLPSLDKYSALVHSC